VHVCVDEPPASSSAAAPSQTQLYALDFVPAAVARERERFSAHAQRTMGANLLEDLVQEEVRRRERIVAIDDEAVLFCPYASSAPYALMLAPRRRRERFEDDGPSGATLLHDALSRLQRRFGESPPLSLWVRTAPRDAERFCWRIDIAPRIAPAPGLELGIGLHRNDVAPELAAAELRAA
jgi:UDPglucose--hexose-1-phosphate uridylyltransferase